MFVCVSLKKDHVSRHIYFLYLSQSQLLKALKVCCLPYVFGDIWNFSLNQEIRLTTTVPAKSSAGFPGAQLKLFCCSRQI